MSRSSRSDRPGKLYGVGVGPGDPELLTIKAARILGSVPVIAYPAPETGESTARRIAASFISADRTEIAIRVPMRPGPLPEKAYRAGADAIAEHLVEGRDVAVLCEGDPLFYGSFSYLWDHLRDRFVAEIIPGITSLTACAAATGTPLALRDETMAVVPATLPDDALKLCLSGSGTIAVVKIGRHFARLRRLCGELGLTPRATYVAHATRCDQVVRPLGDCDPAAPAPYFSMLLITAAERAVRR